MASKAEKKRKVAGRGGARAGRVVRAPQSTAGPGATEASLLPDGQEPEPESGKEDSELEPEKSEKPTELGTSLMDMKPFFLSRTMLTGLADATWTGEHDMVLEHFVQDPAVPALTIFIDPVFGLKLELGMPVQTQNQIVYFIRQAPVPITPENFEETVQYGTVRGAYIPALLRLLSGVYVPQIFMNKSWPESIRNHFVSHLHRFLASLTDTRYKLEGHTVLYIPAEAVQMDPEVVVKDKELVQRLETSMIHWTRQIKEVLSAQESVETGENLGPLEEIEFWHNRCMDLSSISKQLVKKGVKHIESILFLAKSSYLTPFRKLAQQIQDGSRQAQSNLTFLSILREPYQELAFMKPKDISEKLPKLISLIRIIWVNSPHYNTRERLTALFRKMSNEIIRLCCHSISLDRIFEGYVNSSKEDLEGCISCCQAWKEHYLRAVQMHTQFSNRGWVLDQTSIFAQVDAFVQRCKDLIEVCECQYHFARWEDGKQGPLPCFFGAQGPQITRNLLEIEDIFHKNLQTLRAVRGGILDVKNTSWHEDYNKFRGGIKDLEVMTQNLITSAFELVRDVEHGVLLLDTFHRLATREAIMRTYEKKAVDLYMLFNSELALVNRELNKKWPYLEPYMTQYSGQAHWVRILRRRIDRVMNCLSGAHFLPHIGTGEESIHTYQQMAQAIDEMVRKTFQEWTATLDKDCIRRLDMSLLRISQEKVGMLDVNFDKTLLILFAEIDYWERLLFETPHYVMNVAERAEDLRILRENLLLVARDYNRIIAMLSPDEQALFKERIRFLDKKIHPGLKKLNWALKGASAFFITECRMHASKVQMIVNDFKASTLTIGWKAQEMSELLLVHITGKQVYRDLEFEEAQREHRMAAQQKLVKLHQDVVNIMTNSYEVFKNDGPEIQQQWLLYTIRLDHMMEDALRLNVKWSLLELSKAINGDGKTTPNPLFRVLVILQNDVRGGGSQVEFSPTLQTLASVVNDIGSHLFATISVFRHLPDILTKRKMNREPIYVLVERDEDIRKIQAQISSGMTNNASLLQNYLKTWDMYREIWEINKDSFIRRYQRLNPPVSSFDADIARYTEVANNVQKEETVLNIQFVMLDCSHLKFSLVQHCNEWQNKFTTLLKEMAAGRLADLHSYLKDNAEKISHPPQTLEELGVSLQLMDTLQHDLPNLETQIPPIHEQFTILEKYEVPVPDTVLEMLESLNGEWLTFQQILLDSEQMLKKHKEKFKTGLIHAADDFKKKAHNLLEDFEFKGPFTSTVGHTAALDQIAQMRAMLMAMRDEENNLRSNLGIFKIEQPVSKDLQILEKELDALQQVWEITRDWEESWNQWKMGCFQTLQTEAMESMAHGLFRRLTRLAKEYKDRNWEIIETTRSKIEQFKRTMPLISDLRNPALRERHWDQVKEEVQREFDQESESFTLEQIVKLGMDQHVEKIAEISASATKELAIEVGLQNIAKTWDSTQLDIVPYKDKGHHRLRGTEEVFQALEDNQVALSTMKASRFVKAFEKDVDHWERCLSLILEVIEMVLTVQRQWMYLENIFLGEDIRKQLPNESALFDQVNNNWKAIMDRMNKDNNALRSTHYPGLLETLIEMNAILEDIQKSLDMYLETKRHIFPRFYFLSNDDLLEILGQSRNPEAVQPHLKKCFDNIKLLKIQKVGGSSSKWEAVGMFSGDGEYIDFLHPVLLEGPVESWLGDVERAMRMTLRDLLRNCRVALKKFLNKRDKWVKDWAGQVVITASQIQWTADVTKCLMTAKERSDKKILKVMKKKQVSILNKYSEAIRGNLTKIMRLKIVALVTIEIHARDVLEKLYKSGLMDVSSFDWLSQLRFYWEKDVDDCIIRQTNTQFQYGYEYLGNSGRLVITPLTDRCYMTLTTALHLHRGGSPKGPAGTGKTETVKDLGKALGIYVIVVNCSEGLDYKSMGRMYSGLAQSGAWGCFDEFNRINIEVLSVVAQQILSILSALTANLTRFYFEGFEINLVWSCGIFITMNPGYAGRTELPENLKSMFRPIAMVVPDSTLIAEIILFGEGFGNCKILAKKVYTLYSLAVQQLSRQDHYDFGLRALTSLLRYAGKKRRLQPDLSDEEVLLLSMRDMNIAKLTSVDVPLFNAIVQDLFPNIELPVIDYGKLRDTIEQEIREMGLQITPFTLTKVLQLYETKNSRHSTMIVGGTGSSKTTSWKILQASLTSLCRAGEPNYNIVREFPLNPKALSLGELYGEYDLNTNEWTDGILSSVMRVACADEKPDEKWILFDGPVDTLWIESMNSVMDDNKVLTLINGERIAMPEQVSLLFEVENLAVASPATVSRCGMVYTDYVDLGWKPYVQSWLEKRPKTEVEPLQRMFEKFINKILSFKKDNCNELVPVPEYSGIISLCKLYTVLATPENGVNPADAENYSFMVEMTFVFSMIWSVCASVDEDGRKKIDSYLREIEGSFPNKDTVYEYYVNPKMRTWTSFEEKLPKSWRYPPNAPFYKIMVPTVDTVRYNYLVSTLVANQNPVLLVGPVGTGKTSIAQSVLQSLPSSQWSVLVVNMSAQTTSNNVQSIIESRVEKRTKGVYVPFGGKSMITFMDDLNMPAKDMFGSQPPLELIRLWIDYGFWYDRVKQSIKHIRDMFLMAAMGPPGGGRTVISPRLQSRFNIINMTFPTESQIIRIFGTMINQKLQDFEEEVKPIGNVVTEATLDVYNTVVQRFLPTPAKIHYLFNLRDISKVFQGMLRANKDFHDTKASITRLWIHECFRVFSDRLVDTADMEAFMGILSDKLGTFFDLTFHHLCPNKRPPIFGDFLKEPKVYEDLVDLTVLKTAMETALNEYNLSPSVVPMQLVLFREAIEHITRIVRVIGQPRGNMLLVGIGGSGRQSLARLASSICDYNTFQIEVTKHYRKQEFRDDIKRLYRQAGVELQTTSFLFVDTQIADESFLEDINNILSSGEVPNLYKSDEFEEIQNHIIDQARAEQIPESSDSLFAYLIERVRNNLHIVLCLSPVGDPFRNWIRQYPALVNCTTINWFSEWPREALLEVAEKYIIGVDLGTQENIHRKVAQIFVTMHWSVAQYSQKMLLELRRYNYVTPTNYLELVSGYKKLLGEKRQELLDQANKLRTGLFKIDETREKVEVMSLELEDAKKKVAEFQKQCEEYLVIIVQQKREADEQQKAVTANSEKIAIEEVKCQALADNAQKDLEEALPALEEAMRALESLNKKDIGEIKSYGRPPAQVEIVMQAVMILRGNEPTWAEAKRQLGEQNFIKSLINFDKDNISDKVLKKIGAYCAQPDFQPDIIGRVSLAAKSLCMWVRAMELYGRLYRVVEPKRIRMNAAMAQLQEKQAALAEAQEKLREVAEKLEMLKKQYDEKLAQKEELRKKSEEMELKLERAGMLVSGLAGEKARWEETVQGLEEDLGYLVGDCLIAAAFLSYMGPFLTNYRDEIINQIWIRKIRELQVPCSPRFAIDNFLTNPTKVRDWNIQGLPSDAFSTENGIIVTRGNRWALMIDPQGQALKWIKNMEGNQGLKIIDLQMHDYLRVLEHAIQFGFPVLLQNVQEYLDPTLNPVLNKSVARIGGRMLIRIGDKEVEYNPNFRFYLTTKLSNPHYNPETSAKTTIVNFAVKEQGLEAQLLGIVVRKERPELEEQKDSLVINIAAGKRKLKELEDEILRLLNEATGSLLDDVQLVNTLQTSKITATEVTEQLETSETTEINIDLAREAYRPCAQRASVLFFVLNDMGRIDPMYQFSLDAYIGLFILSIDKSHRSNKLEDRIEYLNDYHTYAVYRYTCRTLFERHKLLFSFHMCAKILETSGKLNMDEYNFFLRGGVVLDREGQMDNPCTSWLADAYWDNITELDKLTNFHGLMNSFEQYPRDWHLWYTNSSPEKAMLPGEWENACNEMQRMLIVRSLRQDRVAFCVTSFIVSNLGSRFIEPPVLNMKSVMEDSTPRSPLVFILSPGVDPTSALLQLAEHTGMAHRFHALSLGQGQAPIAARLLREGVNQGHWVFLANCHLSLSWMPNLDKLVEQLQVEDPHPSFRLWLSSSPHPDFPISILQASIKMTTEPPKGLKANMTRLYQLMTEAQFTHCSKPAKYKKLLFALCFFHSILLERKKFLQLGWNIIYGFNDSDFEVSENLLSLYLDEYEETPWDALKYLIAGVNYGGHVTDDWDRRLLTTYINDYFCDLSLTTPFYRLSVLDTYYIPKDGSLASYKEYISMLPSMDPPEAFGQHPNADVASQITEARTLFETLLSLQPQITPTRVGGQSREEKVLELAADVKQKIPEMIDYEGTRKLLALDPSPLNVVLLQEIQRYNKLMKTILFSLTDLEKGIQGLIVMSTSLEEIFNCIFDAHVPPLWGKVYPSQKPLASWTRDLAVRVEQFETWASRARPPVLFWLSGFTFPTGFLTAVLQSAARQNNISVDSLSWEFIVSTVDDSNLVYPPKDGVWVRGLYLEGAGWDRKNSCLVEAEPMQLVCLMPTIHFRPAESRKKSAKGMYSCPCYYYPNRAGSTDRASFVIGIDLRSGSMTSDHWIKRGTALLMSLDS
ncbi:dynein axonemal heavy chain 2 isoform 1 [Mus musculus]|uniref:dynein axonemal heavy chain 2 isoform 1 n=3 Tax=Mus musculus TaxID=10090 RepID=UPI0003D71515|nr:dynein axonemal heavy chain 2 isoform 1 [Mus musculus]|eukprot:XP_006533615.1 PREDICTED: dynein heavy chain 2, axonemal isoform X2 [Mus musculus]